MPSKRKFHKPRWYGIPLRVAVVTFLVTILSFAVSLLLGILGIILVARIRGGAAPKVTLAYRNIAVPAAVVAGVIVLVISLAMEIRHYRQTKALAEIERAG